MNTLIKVLTLLCISTFSLNSYSQKLMTPEESLQLRKEYANAWKIQEIKEDSSNIYSHLLMNNFFVTKTKKHGTYNVEINESSFYCCWKKTKNKIVFKDGNKVLYTFHIKHWSEDKIILTPNKNSIIELILEV